MCAAARLRGLCRAGDFARRLGFAASQGFAGQRLCKTEMFHPPQTSPAGVNARPTMRNTRAVERGRQAAARFGGTMRALPPAGGVSERSRYEVPALSAEIVPYGCGARLLPGFAGYLWGKAAMHPSVTFGDTSPCRGGFTNGCFPQRLPCKGSCRRMPTEGCRTLPHLYPCGLAGVCCIRRGQSPALTPALRAGEPPKRRLRAAVPASSRPAGLAAG